MKEIDAGVSMACTDGASETHLKRRLSTLTMVGMAFAILNTWIALAGSLGIVLPSGGSVAFLYGFIFCVFCNLCLGASLGEMASVLPTAGGQYHFTYALCSERWKRFVSFWTGWTSIAGWLTLVTTEAFFSAQFFSAAGVIGSNGSYVPAQWKTYLIAVAVITFGTLINLFGNRMLARWNDCALYHSLTACAVICITILATANHTDVDFVFTDFKNETGWSDGMSWILGLLQSALSLIGYDAVCHMTEEMPRPTADAPKAVLYSILIGGVTGVLFILAMLFCLSDPEAVLGTSTGMPITELIFRSTNSRACAVVLTVSLGVCFVNGTLGCITTSSRLIYAMARDNGIVFPSTFGRIRKGLDVPVECIILTFIFNIFFGLLYLGPTVAFSAYAASCTIFLNVSYAIPVAVVCFRGRKVLEQLQSPSTPFKLGRVTGTICNWVAITFVAVTSMFFCFPLRLSVDPGNMNYVSAVIGIFLLMLSAYYIVYGKRYDGPELALIIEVDGVEVPSEQAAIPSMNAKKALT